MNVLNLLRDVDISSHVVAMGICVVVGAAVLTNYTRLSGIIGFALNGLALLAGAQLGNSFQNAFEWPLNFTVERTLLLTMGGMLPVSLAILLVFARPRRG